MSDLRHISACVLLIVFGALAAGTPDRIQIKVDFSEAEQALAIIGKHNGGKDITDADFKKFILSPDLDSQYDALHQTLDQWNHADMEAAAQRALAYLPASATVRTKVFPLIKPKHN